MEERGSTKSKTGSYQGNYEFTVSLKMPMTSVVNSKVYQSTWTEHLEYQHHQHQKDMKSHHHPSHPEKIIYLRF